MRLKLVSRARAVWETAERIGIVYQLAMPANCRSMS
ncbi:hypothetical protein [Escherichia coli]